MPSRIAKSTASWTRTASSISRPPIMTAPLIWTSGSSPGSRTMPRGSSSAANIMRPAKWTWSISISSWITSTTHPMSDHARCRVFSERAYGTARESYRFRETTFDIYQVADSLDRPYMVKISTGEGACKDAGLRFASVGEAKAWCHRYSLREPLRTRRSPSRPRPPRRRRWRPGALAGTVPEMPARSSCKAISKG